MGASGGVLGKDKWEWGMGRRALCSANGSCAFPWSGWPRLLLTVLPLHCNYLHWRDSYWERGQQNSRTWVKTDRVEGHLSSHSHLQEDFLQKLLDSSDVGLRPFRLFIWKWDESYTSRALNGLLPLFLQPNQDIFWHQHSNIISIL